MSDPTEFTIERYEEFNAKLATHFAGESEREQLLRRTRRLLHIAQTSLDGEARFQALHDACFALLRAVEEGQR